MNEIEQSVWRTVRAVTILAVLVVLLLVAGSIANMFDLSLVGGWRQPYEPRPAEWAPGAGVRVQSYAEIVPGAQNTAHAWALGPDQQGNMSSNTIADEQQLSAAAQSVWPRPTAALVMEGRSGLAEVNKGVAPTVTSASAERETLPPRFLVQIPLANLRAGPGTDYAIVGTAAAGARYAITARYGDWWQVDADGAPGAPGVWVHGALGAVEGDAGTVQAAVVLPASSGSQPTATPAASVNLLPAMAPTATPTRLPGYAYSVEMTRHPESNTVVVYALIQDNQAIVGDLYLAVEHNGQRWRSEPSSYAVQGVTKPSEPGSPYNRTYNAKIDFPLFLFPVLDMTGTWAVTLVDGAGQPLSVISTITIAADDPQREIYLYYRKIKL